MTVDDEIGLLEEQCTRKDTKHRTRHHEMTLQSVLERLKYVIAVGCAFIIFLLGAATGPYWAGRLDVLCLEETSIPSPLSAHIKISYHEQHFNSTLFGTSIYRQDPSPEVDQAWVDLGVYLGVVLIDQNQALEGGITRGHVKTPKDDGSRYFANIEAFHQLHCLNLLRKTNHWNYDYYHDLGEYEFENEEHFLRLHADHCLDSLREQLMCTADIGVLPYIRIKGKDRAYPDFPAAPHKCRNFDDIRSWVRNAQVGKLDPKLLHNIEPGDILLDEIP